MARTVWKKTRPVEVSIVGLEGGGLGWRVTDDDGTPLNLSFGTVLASPVLSDESPELQVSNKAIDKVLKAYAERRSGKPSGKVLIGNPSMSRLPSSSKRRPATRAFDRLEVKSPPRATGATAEELD
jgi:hypothetical protein